MLDESIRTAILERSAAGRGIREIARSLDVSRSAVAKVLASKSQAPPQLKRPEKAETWRDEIREQYAECKGNLVRVHEELKK